MLQYRSTIQRAIARGSSRFTIESLAISLAILAVLLAGCGDAHQPLATAKAPHLKPAMWGSKQPPTEPAGLELPIPSAAASCGGADAECGLPADRSTGDLRDEGCVTASYPSDVYWSFPQSGEESLADSYPVLIPLPPVEESGPAFEPADSVAPPALEAPALQEPELVAQLLSPRPIAEAPTQEPGEPLLAPPLAEVPESEVLRQAVPNRVMSEVTPTPTTNAPIFEELNRQQRSLSQLLSESIPAATGVLTDGRIDQLAKSKIQHAYALANRGSLYAARGELIEVLRMISQARDAKLGANPRSTALAAGLRALREAQDFAPTGAQLEADLDISVLCASHRTPVAKSSGENGTPPRLMLDRYLRYAQLQLSLAVAGDPAGSMALHALGKLHSQLGRIEPDKHRLSDRRAIAYQQAALLAHNQNHLAAHELGVLLAKSGHFEEAHQLLTQVASREPNPIVYRNLARVQDELGWTAQAIATRQTAERVNHQSVADSGSVRWTPAEQFAQSSVQGPYNRSTNLRTAAVPRHQSSQLPLPGTRKPLSQNIRR